MGTGVWAGMTEAEEAVMSVRGTARPGSDLPCLPVSLRSGARLLSGRSARWGAGPGLACSEEADPDSNSS